MRGQVVSIPRKAGDLPKPLNPRGARRLRQPAKWRTISKPTSLIAQRALRSKDARHADRRQRRIPIPCPIGAASQLRFGLRCVADGRCILAFEPVKYRRQHRGYDNQAEREPDPGFSGRRIGAGVGWSVLEAGCRIRPCRHHSKTFQTDYSENIGVLLTQVTFATRQLPRRGTTAPRGYELAEIAIVSRR